jgi:hypothetical protein
MLKLRAFYSKDTGLGDDFQGAQVVFPSIVLCLSMIVVKWVTFLVASYKQEAL